VDFLSSNVIGWLSSLCLTLCGLPLAWEALRTGHVRGIHSYFILLWTVGELLGIVYVWGDKPLMLNYGFNLAVCIILCWYNWRPRDNDIKTNTE
jgi:hypothetical protein